MTDLVKILVIDDEADSIVGTLTTCGFAATACSDSRQLLDQLSKRSYDLVFCNAKLSGTSGVELMSRALQRFPEIAFVIVTERDNLRPGILAMMSGASDYIQAPLCPETVAASVRRALWRKLIERALAESP